MTKPAVSVWDLPTRLFHWLLVILIAVSWWSAETRTMEWHYRSGLAILGLVVFRIVWGVIGGSTARFASFVRLPGAALSYLRGQAQDKAGHNPLGGYSVILLLAVIAAQVSGGLFASDTDGLESGPMSFLVSYELSREITDLHEQWSGPNGEFSFKAMGFNVSGSIHVGDSSVDITGDLPMMAIPFKGQIEQRIQERAAALLA